MLETLSFVIRYGGRGCHLNPLAVADHRVDGRPELGQAFGASAGKFDGCCNLFRGGMLSEAFDGCRRPKIKPVTKGEEVQPGRGEQVLPIAECGHGGRLL